MSLSNVGFDMTMQGEVALPPPVPSGGDRGFVVETDCPKARMHTE
jgi:hypothetical protein